MANLFYMPFRPSYDSAGISVPGAKAYFTLTGTNTAAAPFSNSGLTIPRSNPVVADSTGKFPTTYLDPAKTYRVRIYSKNATVAVDTPLEEFDPYVPGLVDAGALTPIADAAAASATAASTSAGEAADSATDAATSATASAASATASAGSATAAAGSATAAAGSAISAAAAAASIVSVPNAHAVAATRTALAALGTTAPAYLYEAGRQGMFVFDSSNLSAKVTADPDQGIYVAPASAPTGASGAWVRTFASARDPKWSGAALDGVADDSAEFASMETSLLAGAQTGYGYSSKSKNSVRIPLGVAKMGTTPFDVYGSGIIEGVNGSLATGGGSVLLFSADTSGVRLQNEKTLSDNSYDGAAPYASSTGTILSKLYLTSSNTGFNALHSGIRIKTVGVVEDVFVNGFAGDGVYANTNILATDGTFGSASLSQLHRVFVQSCAGDGFHLQGADSNVITTSGCSAISNAGYGFNEKSFLGNLYLGCHSAANTLGGYHSENASNASVFVGCYEEGGQPASTFGAKTLRVGGFWANSGYAQGGGLIQAVDNKVEMNDLHVVGSVAVDTTAAITGAITAASFTVSGVFSAAANGNVTAYGQTHNFGPNTGTTDSFFVLNNTGTYNHIEFRSGGGAQKDGEIQTARNSGMYVDGAATGANLFFRPNASAIVGTMTTTGLSITGTVAATGAVTGSNLSGTNTGDQTTITGNAGTATTLQTSRNFSISGGGITAATVGFNGSAAVVLNASVDAAHITLARMANLAAVSLIGNATGGAATPTAITLAADHSFSGTTLQLGAFTGDITKTAGSLATTIANAAVTYAKFQTVAANALVGNPTGSTATPQAITLAGGLGNSGTTLTINGAVTAATSVAIAGAITSSSATAGMGYATGAGGAVTQLTSKSTAPPSINKVCGQITMNNAALAAGAKVSFTVSNTACAATDIPQVAVISGGTANAYRANITAVAASSFTVTVENITAGSLSEAPVIGFFINKAVAA